MMKKSPIVALACAASAALAAAAAFAAGATPRGAAAMPRLEIALHGVHGISLSASTVPSGAVTVASTFAGKAPSGPDSNPPSAGIVRLDPGVSFQTAAGAVTAHRGDLDALTPYGTLLVSATAPSTVQATLSPGSYVALNTIGNGEPASAPFTVTDSAAPDALPPASAVESAVEFAFHGPTVLRDGTVVRARNDGYLVHMIDLVGVRDAATGHTVIALLRAGKDRQAEKLAGHAFVNLLGPASPGALQQQVLHASPGYYVEVCFMDTQDHREHTQLGMVRLVRVTG